MRVPLDIQERISGHSSRNSRDQHQDSILFVSSLSGQQSGRISDLQGIRGEARIEGLLERRAVDGRNNFAGQSS